MPVYQYECPQGHEYEEFLLLKDYQKKTKCPECNKAGKKCFVMRQSAPTFTDKIFPYHDKALNRIFEYKQQRDAYLKRKGLVESGSGSMTKQQERTLMSWKKWGKEARYANRD